MRHLFITTLLMFATLSQAQNDAGKAPDLSSAIKEASFSQKMLHRRLLRILQGTEYAIAKKEIPPTQLNPGG